MSDYVTIYCTMAIVSAILIAAVGLLAGNQILAFASARRQLAMRTLRSDLRVESLVREREEANSRLQIARVQLHLEQFIVDVARSSMVPTFEEVQATHPAVDLDQVAYRSEYNRQRNDILQARELLTHHQASIGSEHSLDRWATRQRLDVSDYDLRFLDIAYDLAWRQAQVARLRQEEAVQRQRPWPWSMGTALIWPKNELALIHDLAEEADYEAESLDRQNALASEIELLQTRLKALEGKVPVLQRQAETLRGELAAAHSPVSPRLVLLTLGALGVTGIVLPLSGIVLQSMVAWLTWPVLGLFFLSLGGLGWSVYDFGRAVHHQQTQ